MATNVEPSRTSPESVIIEDDAVSEIVLDDDSSDDSEKSNKKKDSEYLKSVFKEWKSQDFSELLIVKDYMFHDPLIDTLRPHEAFVYTLGLNLALETACNTYKYLVNKGKKTESTIKQTTNANIDDTNQKENISKDAEKKNSNLKTEPNESQHEQKALVNRNTTYPSTIEKVLKQTSDKVLHLNIGIRNEYDFLANLEENTNRIKLLNKSFTRLEMKQCRLCDYKSESTHVIDTHLTKPHNVNFNSKSHKYNEKSFMCSFCTEPNNVFDKEEYSKHMFLVHKRFYNHERPLNSYMCHLCEYECTKKNRLVKHHIQCNDNLAFKEAFLKKLQEPSISDYLDYEFLFPSIETIRKNNQLSQQKEIQQQSAYNKSNPQFLSPKPVLSRPMQSAMNPVCLDNSLTMNRIKTTETVKNLIQINQNRYVLPKPSSIEKFTLNGFIPVKLSNGSIRLIQDENKSSIKSINNTNSVRQLDIPSAKGIENKDSSPVPVIQNTNLFNSKDRPVTSVSPSVDTIPKYLICPICKISIKSLIDLTAHIQRTHSLDDKTTNLIINEKVIPQLNYAFANKTPVVQPHTPNRVSAALPPATLSTLHNSYNNKMPPQKPKLKIVDQGSEQKLISDFLKANNLSESKLVEIKSVKGKCFMCQYTTVYDLPNHLKQTHAINIRELYKNETLCAFCGFRCFNRQQMITHQFNTHRIIQYLSANKIFTVQKGHKPYNLHQNSNNEAETHKNVLKITKIQNSKEVTVTVKKNLHCTVPDKPPSNNTMNHSQINKNYTCSECNRTYEDFYMYCSHLIKGHQETNSIMNCPVCQRTFKGADYQLHIRTHLKNCKIELNRLNKSTTDEDVSFEEPANKRFKPDLKFNEIILLDD